MNPTPPPPPVKLFLKNCARGATVVVALGFLTAYVLLYSGRLQLHAAEGGNVTAPPPNASASAPKSAASAQPKYTVADLHAPSGTALPPQTVVVVSKPKDPIMLASSKTLVLTVPVKVSTIPEGTYVVGEKSELIPAPSTTPQTGKFIANWALTTESNTVIPIAAMGPAEAAPPPVNAVSTPAKAADSATTAAPVFLGGSKSAPVFQPAPAPTSGNVSGNTPGNSTVQKSSAK